MHPAVSQEEAWLLELVVEARYPLSVLSSPDIALHLNRPGHGLPIEHVAAALHRLSSAGLIHIDRVGASPAPSCDELRALLSLPAEDSRTSRARRYYGLTPEGGAMWEQIASPDWARFVSATFGVDPNDAEVIGVERSLVESFVYGPTQRFVPIPGSEQWEVLGPWAATYWKTLPHAHRVRYLYGEMALLPSNDSSERRAPWDAWFERVALPPSP